MTLTTLYLVLFSLVGLILGSFLNVIIYRLPVMLEQETATPLNLATPRSHCRHCQTTLPWYHNIPLLSFCILKGKCHQCHQAISWQYPAVELLSALIAVLLFLHFQLTPQCLIACVIFWTLLASAVIDFRHSILPDSLTYIALWLALLANAFNLFLSPQVAILSAVIGYFILYIPCQIYAYIIKKPTMGHGDYKLTAALCALLGYQNMPLLIFLASVLTILFSLPTIIKQKSIHSIYVPFGPGLIAAGFIVLMIKPH